MKYDDKKAAKLFGFDTGENCVKLGKCEICSPEKLMQWMNKNIKYHLESEEYSEKKNEKPTQTALELVKSKKGHCAEQSYLEQYVLNKLGYDTQLVFVKENDSKKDYGADGSAHMFLMIKEEDKYIWFEHAMRRMRGIHDYNSLNSLLKDVAKNWRRYDDKTDTLEFRFIDRPITGVSNLELAKRCHRYPVKKTFDISKNAKE